MPNREQLAAAVNYLIEAPRAPSLTKRIGAMVDRWNVEPMAFAGELAVLNVLIDVGLKNREALNKLIALADTRRNATVKAERRAKRQKYQRELMQRQRSLLAKATVLHEQRVGHLTRKGRDAFASVQLKEWERQRAALLASRPDLDWAGRHAAIGEFWAQVDADLSERLKPARDASSAEAHMH